MVCATPVPTAVKCNSLGTVFNASSAVFANLRVVSSTLIAYTVEGRRVVVPIPVMVVVAIPIGVSAPAE